MTPVKVRGHSPHSEGLLRRIGRAGPIYAMLLPSLVLVLLIAYYPALSAIYHSFFDWSYAGTSTFVGFDNFRRMFSDEIFGASFLNLMQLTAFGVLIKRGLRGFVWMRWPEVAGSGAARLRWSHA